MQVVPHYHPGSLARLQAVVGLVAPAGQLLVWRQASKDAVYLIRNVRAGLYRCTGWVGWDQALCGGQCVNISSDAIDALLA